MISDNIDKKLQDQDEAARKSAEEYAKNHKEEAFFDEEKEEKGTFLDRIISPIIAFVEKLSDRYEKNHEKNKLKEEKLTGGASTLEEKKIKGFSKKHVLVIGTILTLVVVFGVALGSSSMDKKAKKEDNDINRGAITGQHMTTMPKDYTELAAAKRRKELEAERKRAEEEENKKKRNNEKRDTRPVSEQAKDNRREIYTPMRNSSEDRAREAKLLKENSLRELRKAAMSSPIAFEIRKK